MYVWIVLFALWAFIYVSGGPFMLFLTLLTTFSILGLLVALTEVLNE